MIPPHSRGACPLALQAIRNRNHKARVDPHPVGISTIAVDAGALAIGTQIFFSLQAPLAVPAGVGLPANAHPVAGIQAQHGAPGYGDLADDLMARDQGIVAYAPVIVDHVDVAAADAAMGDGNFHLVRLNVPGIVLVGQQFGASSMGGESLKERHRALPLAVELSTGISRGPA